MPRLNRSTALSPSDAYNTRWCRVRDPESGKEIIGMMWKVRQRSLDILTQKGRTLKTTLDQCRSLKEPLLEKHDDRKKMLKAPFVLACTCGTDSNHLKSFNDASQEGWSNIIYDDGMSWNFLGDCPACVREAVEETRRRLRKKTR